MTGSDKLAPDAIAVALPPEDIFNHIQGLERSSSRSHKIVAAAILMQPKIFIEKPIEDLAPWVGFSAPRPSILSCAKSRILEMKSRRYRAGRRL
jgi:hypothetical protein